MPYVDIVTALAVLQFIVFGVRVGVARGKYGIKAPAISGNEIFERYFRIQQNTLETLIAFVPGIYLFSRYWNPLWAAGIGGVYLVGREIYAATYVKDPAKRELGYGLTIIPLLVLLAGALIGAVLNLIRG